VQLVRSMATQSAISANALPHAPAVARCCSHVATQSEALAHPSDANFAQSASQGGVRGPDPELASGPEFPVELAAPPVPAAAGSAAPVLVAFAPAGFESTATFAPHPDKTTTIATRRRLLGATQTMFDRGTVATIVPGAGYRSQVTASSSALDSGASARNADEVDRLFVMTARTRT